MIVEWEVDFAQSLLTNHKRERSDLLLVTTLRSILWFEKSKTGVGVTFLHIVNN